MWRAGPAEHRHLANDGGSALDGLATMDDGRGASLLRGRTSFPTAVTVQYTPFQAKVTLCNPPAKNNVKSAVLQDHFGSVILFQLKYIYNFINSIRNSNSRFLNTLLRAPLGLHLQKSHTLLWGTGFSLEKS